MLDTGDTVMTEADTDPAHMRNAIYQTATQRDGWFLLDQLMKGQSHHKVKKQKPTEKNICNLRGHCKANIRNIQSQCKKILRCMERCSEEVLKIKKLIGYSI